MKGKKEAIKKTNGNTVCDNFAMPIGIAKLSSLDTDFSKPLAVASKNILTKPYKWLFSEHEHNLCESF